MASDERLHPVSVLFALTRSASAFVLPGLFLLLGTTRSSGGASGPFGSFPEGWELWAMLLLIPSTVTALVRYFSFRLRYEGSEIVIRSGVLFRNERHIPYARIQNLNAVRNVFHRLFGVTEVQIETGAGKKPEATISVIPVAAFERMRRHVFEARTLSAGSVESTEGVSGGPAPAEGTGETLLRLSTPDLVLHGVLDNRGLVPIGAAVGLLWQYGILEGLLERLTGTAVSEGRLVRRLLEALGLDGPLGGGQVVVVAAGVIGVLALVQAFSIVWAVMRLHAFRLTRVGEDLRTEYGLLTRVAGTIPLRRVQTITIRQSLWQRLAARASVRVDTAGGGSERAQGRTTEREWLAPIIRTSEVASLLHVVLPELDFDAIAWRPPHPGAFRRAVKPALAFAGFLVLALSVLVDPRASIGIVAAVPWAVFATRRYVSHLGWAATDDVVAFRSGWVSREVTVARTVKMQAVTLFESPFDRRTAMARLRVDTAGAGPRSHRVDIPYLPRDVARALHATLAARAATTAFRW